MKLDFVQKFKTGKVRSYQDYVNLCKDNDLLLIAVTENAVALKAIAEGLQPDEPELPPLEPMLTTLRRYCKEADISQMEKTRIQELTGDHNSVYYGILQTIVQTFLTESQTSTSRCIILHGATSSGKSTIAKYLGNIFSSFGLRQHKGPFDGFISREDTHVQLLVLDEANVYKLFGKDNLSDTKLLLEGEGRSQNAKFAQPFTGFKGCYTIVTCNTLPYPFRRPTNSSAGFIEEEWETDKKAIEARCELIKMSESFNRRTDTFPFTEE